jgi:MinD superfamily P-loop ATPase
VPILIVTVASGKGGTGKTTVAVNLALSLENVLLFDCDVEAPNAHLFLKLGPLVTIPVGLPVPVIDQDRCSLCKKCSEFCEYSALFVGKDRVLVYDEMCHSCGGCMLVCPEGAISEANKEIGVVHSGEANGIRFAYGELNVGEPSGIALIRQLKSRADPTGINIIDAPPGTACPVVETMDGSDFVVLVTEPTPFGIHDLSMAIEVVKELGTPCGIVVNKHMEGNELARQYSQKSGIPILLEIPFSRNIAELYSRGIPFAVGEESWKEQFIHLYQRIEETAKGAK